MSSVIKSSRLLFVHKQVDCTDGDKEDFEQPEIFADNAPEDNDENESENIYQETKAKLMELLEESKQEAREIEKSAKKKAQIIIEEAEKQAAEIIKEAAEDTEKDRREVFEQAKKEGYEIGFEQAKEKHSKAEALIKKAENERKKIISAAEIEVVELAIQIAEKIIRSQLSIDKETIKKIAGNYLSMLQNAKRIVLKICADDQIFLSHYRQELQNLVPNCSLEFETDNTLSGGDVLVVSDNGIIEARIDEQLKIIKEALMEVYANA